MNNENDKKINTKLVSLGSAAMAGIYQYNLIKKSHAQFSNRKTFGYCTGAAFICYIMTNVILNNINQM